MGINAWKKTQFNINTRFINNLKILRLSESWNLDWATESNKYREAICGGSNVALSSRNENLPLEDYSPTPNLWQAADLAAHKKSQVEEAHSSEHYDNRKGFMSNYLKRRCITKHSAFLQLKAYSGFFFLLLFLFWLWQARHKFCITVVQTLNRNICLNNCKCRALKCTKS